MTALAFTYFAQEGVDWAVLETGLGGRLDATNVVTPAVCAITSLSYDHVELLGHSLPEIAAEKAGIIKTGVPVVSAPQAPEALAVIERVCSERSARLIRAGVDWTATRQSADLSGQTLTLRRTADGLTLPDLRIALLGDHQIINATVAVALLAELRAQGVGITDDVLRKGLTAAHWPGRFEHLNQRPVLVVDSAHNIDSALRLRATLAEFFPHTPKRRLALVFGASADKDIPGILEGALVARRDRQLCAARQGDRLSERPPAPGRSRSVSGNGARHRTERGRRSARFARRGAGRCAGLGQAGRRHLRHRLDLRRRAGAACLGNASS